jgi:hypothetical protein
MDADGPAARQHDGAVFQQVDTALGHDMAQRDVGGGRCGEACIGRRHAEATVAAAKGRATAINDGGMKLCDAPKLATGLHFAAISLAGPMVSTDVSALFPVAADGRAALESPP